MKRIVLFLLIALVLLVSCNQDEVHEHKFDEGTVTTAPTCTQNGVKTFKCKCGETKTEEIDALGHDKVDVAAKEATCTEVGWNEYEKCKREGCGYTTYEEIAAIGHSYGELQTTAATCEKDGEEYKICSVCNDRKVEKTLTKLAHDLEKSSTTAATCTNKAIVTYKCKNCDYTENGEEGDKNPNKHTGNTEWKVTTAATYFAKGTETEYCKDCGVSLGTTREKDFRALTGFWEGKVTTSNGDTIVMLSFNDAFQLIIATSKNGDYWEDPNPYDYTVSTTGITTTYYTFTKPSENESNKGVVGDTISLIASSDLISETEITVEFTRKTVGAHTHTYADTWEPVEIKNDDGYITDVGHSKKMLCTVHTAFDLFSGHDYSSGDTCSVCGEKSYYEVMQLVEEEGTRDVNTFCYVKEGESFKLPGESSVTYTLNDTTTTYQGSETYTPDDDILITDVAYSDLPADNKTDYTVLSTYVAE